MHKLRTYQYRLTIYTALLLVFLISILSYTYYSSRAILLDESGLRVNTTTQLMREYLDLEEQELLHYAEIVGDDQRVQEYTFMVVKVGTDTDPLNEVYKRHFGWLPVSHRMLVTTKGRILLGEEYPELAMAVLDRIARSKDEVFYLPSSQGVDMVTWAPINYQNTRLGMVALVTTINEAWIQQLNFLSNGFIFIEYNNVIQYSNLENTSGKSFKVDKKGYVRINNKIFRVSAVLNTATQGQSNITSPRIWYGVSENNVLEKLSSHGLFILGVGFLGSVGILIVGFMMLKNFTTPLSKLSEITQQMANGSLPLLSISTAQNEIDMLSNQFADMLQSLREKQQEIDRIHKELQHSAITDILTGLNNRRYLVETFPKLFGQAQRDNWFLFGILIDIDHFKQINDSYGHMAGDQCLIHVAKILDQECRSNDYIYRIGGEEFFVLSLIENTAGGLLLAEKLRAALEKTPANYDEKVIPITASLGINYANVKLSTTEAMSQLLFTSDHALYKAKSSGRNKVSVCQPTDNNTHKHD